MKKKKKKIKYLRKRNQSFLKYSGKDKFEHFKSYKN